MRIISRLVLTTFWSSGHAAAEGPLRAWVAEASKAQWTSSAELKLAFPSASILSKERVVFNIGGNKYRLVVAIHYAPGSRIYIRFVGTHAEYDKIDALTI